MFETAKWIDRLNRMSRADIRKLMNDEGISGLRTDSRECVIARFLKAKDNKLTDLTVSGGCIEFVSDNEYGHVCCATELIEFIRHFDYGWYPELDAHRKYEPKWAVHFGDVVKPTTTMVSGNALVQFKAGVINMTNASYAAIKEYATAS